MGLMVFVLVLAIYKAGMLSVSMVMDWRAFLFLIGIDSFYLAFLMLIAVFHGHSRNRTVRRFFWLILVFMTVTYLVDSFVLLALNEHAPLFDMGRYTLEPVVVLSFFDTSSYIAILLLLISMFITSSFRHNLRKLSYLALIAVVAVGVFSTIYAPLPLTRYAMISPQILWEVIEAERTSDRANNRSSQSN